MRGRPPSNGFQKTATVLLVVVPDMFENAQRSDIVG